MSELDLGASAGEYVRPARENDSAPREDDTAPRENDSAPREDDTAPRENGNARSRVFWVFPALLCIVIGVLSVLEIHGSSVGVYHQFLNGEAEDPDLLFGTPRRIRTDEWLWMSQITVLQAETGAPLVNENLAEGRSLAIRPNAPIADWITVFRPHTWSFFVFDVETAFAFKWWFVSFVLAGAAYAFIARVSGDLRLAALLAVAFTISPFLLWWYQTNLFLPLAFAMGALVLWLRLIDGEPIGPIDGPASRVIHAVGIGYLLVAFAFILYVPFLVPIALVSTAFVVGTMAERRFDGQLTTRELVQRSAYLSISLAMVVGFLLMFLADNRSLIEDVSGSVYPGQRTSFPGNLPLLGVFDGFMTAPLQSDLRGGAYYTNQSEAANFVLLLPYLMIPALVLQVVEFRQTRRIAWSLVSLQLLAALFLAKAFVPFGLFFHRFLLLHRVPNGRLVAGMGFLGLLQLVAIVQLMRRVDVSAELRRYGSVIWSLISLCVALLFGGYVIGRYPDYLSEYSVMIALAVAFVSIMWAFLSQRPHLGAVMLLLFTAASSFRIMPLYRGLAFYQTSDIVQAIEDVSEPGDDWITIETVVFEHLPILAGQTALNGIQIHADNDYWGQLDPTGEYEDIYNRQGHAVFTATPEGTEKFRLIQRNMFHVHFECDAFTLDKAEFVLSLRPLSYECLNEIRQVPYEVQTFFIYEVSSVS